MAVNGLLTVAKLFAGVVGHSHALIADAVAAIVAAAIIAWNGWSLLRPALNELMDSASPPEVVDRIRRIAATIPGVDRVEKCIVRKMGYYFYVDMHVEVDPAMTVSNA